jgi:hypothetical protein
LIGFFGDLNPIWRSANVDLQIDAIVIIGIVGLVLAMWETVFEISNSILEMGVEGMKGGTLAGL